MPDAPVLPADERAGVTARGADPLISARGVGVVRGGQWLIRNIDVDVAPGEVVTVIGPNGGGKTTLLRTLLGLIRPSAGVVTRRPRLRIGYMPQRLVIDRVLPLTVQRLMTLTGRRSRRDVAAALDETGVGGRIDAGVDTLSGGEFQRVMLARALLMQPELLVLDEPVQGVDFTGEADLYRLIGQIRARHGCGVLMVSHDLHVVMASTDRVLCLNQHLCCAGAPHHISRHPEYLRLFGPRAAQAYAVYEHHHDHAHALSGEVVQAPGSDGRHDCHGHGHHHRQPPGTDGA